MPWTLTVRVGPKVRRERFDAPGPAFDALQGALHELPATARLRTTRVLTREYSPEDQVAARAELRAPGLLSTVRGGADVRGDGSVQAWTGWLRRSPVEPRDGETQIQALRRELGA
ncbi:MAG: hypothetical protein QOG77_542 [Solirubrobacteraceae bacterium]|nr:hypothetical protein [Solirubrobacteraceae bacterium]